MKPPAHPPTRQVRTVTEFGLVVREMRHANQWTQAELARHAGVSRRWIVALESGHATRAEFGRVLAVLSALGLPMLLPTFSEAEADDSAPTSNPAPSLDLDAYLATFTTDPNPQRRS